MAQFTWDETEGPQGFTFHRVDGESFDLLWGDGGEASLSRTTPGQKPWRIDVDARIADKRDHARERIGTLTKDVLDA